MKFSAVALFAAAASATAIFKVSDFTAACIAHSAQCSYEFNLASTSTGETTGVSCSAQVTSDGSLPAVTDGTCKESSRTWTVTKNDDGSLVLTASQQATPSSSSTGSHTIAASELEFQQTGASTQQVYTGAAAFVLTS
ncbi:uncharacterized protein BCR38DRAFT_351932 [Pseudomassariella vexata]|uniref:Hypersensitive response-inducing protein n=1 Tax=Pseudomassariella vexata TaxID=1141098 RepID=A0A1Y2DJ19_9PEZI|nr:uncharacterized protein BCR38DRAFT_351932 [Pseudomassariella vexata]ORY59233.1 hypothetical protein BCR38DRAFT_351932 [Pseudomassariella vexata]